MRQVILSSIDIDSFRLYYFPDNDMVPHAFRNLCHQTLTDAGFPITTNPNRSKTSLCLALITI